jgi:hypothetical protein
MCTVLSFACCYLLSPSLKSKLAGTTQSFQQILKLQTSAQKDQHVRRKQFVSVEGKGQQSNARKRGGHADRFSNMHLGTHCGPFTSCIYALCFYILVLSMSTCTQTTTMTQSPY